MGFRFRWVTYFWTARVRKMLRLSVPLALSVGVLQLSVIIDKSLTWLLSSYQARGHWVLGIALPTPMADGALTRLQYAQLLYQFPLGLFAIALATAIFPTLSAEALDRDRTRFKASLRQGIIAALLEGLPASLGLIFVRFPAIRLMFQHGNFTASDTEWVARSTAFFAAGIWAFSLQQILNRAYYAMHDTFTPLLLSLLTLLINTVVEIPLVFTRLGESGMAAGTLVSFSIQAIVMLWMLDRRVEGLGLKTIFSAAARMLGACGAMALACLAVQRLPIFPRGLSHGASLLQLLILVSVGGMTYFLACEAMGLKLRRVLSRNPG